MNERNDPETIWRYASWVGTEQLRREQEQKLSLSRKLDLLDELLDFAAQIHGPQIRIRKDGPAPKKTGVDFKQ